MKVDGKNLTDFFTYGTRCNISTNDHNLIYILKQILFALE